MSHPTILSWRKTDAWKEAEEEYNRNRISAIAGVTAQHIAPTEQETAARRQFKADLIKARDELKTNADIQLKVSTAMFRVSGQALSEALRDGGATEAVALSQHLSRLVSSASIAGRGARDTIQTIYAIEELLEAVQNGKI